MNQQNRKSRPVFFVALVLAAAALPPLPAFAEGAGMITGTWELVSSVAEKDGRKSDQFGPGAKGMLSLDPDGRFMLAIIGADLPHFAANNRAAGTAEESKAVVGKSIAMLGTYSVDPAEKTLVFKIGSSTFPNWNATAQVRHLLRLNEDELQYATPQASGGGTAIVTWRRPRP